MAIEQALDGAWSRKHDLPGASMNAPVIVYPQTLDQLIELCSTPRPVDGRMHAAGSHWALSEAAISDHTFVETHDPHESRNAMGRTLYEVVPNCLSSQFLDAMKATTPVSFEQNVDDQTHYFVHVETGKTIYQLYAELDQDAKDDPEGLAVYLANHRGTQAYYGPWAFRTLGGAGGQTVFGALTTGTHGGDYRQPPIADDVAALHLVTDGGKHYWIEPERQPEEAQLTDDTLLNQLYGAARYGGPENFAIVRDDAVFNAVLVSAGRFGLVYSIVLRAVRQYMLHEVRELAVWQDIRGRIADLTDPLYTSPAGNKFLQIVICLTPHFSFQRNLAGVTRRSNVQWDPETQATPKGRAWRVGAMDAAVDPKIAAHRFQFAGNSVPINPDENDPSKAATGNFMQRACANADFLEGIIESTISEIRQLVDVNKVTAGGVVAAIAATGAGPGVLALAAPLALILAFLLAFLARMRASGGGQREGQVLNEIKDGLLNRADPAERAAGLFAWQMIAYKVFDSEQGKEDYVAISYAVMDLHDYHDRSCNVNVESIEVFFEATNPMLLAFVDAVLAYEIRQELQGKAFVGYMSLRFTGKTRALIGPARWDQTCVVEIAGLKDVSGVTELVDFAMSLSRNNNFQGILHWGQRNESNAADIERRFGNRNDPRNGNLGRWREALATVTDGGKLDGFSSGFTRRTGLEIV